MWCTGEGSRRRRICCSGLLLVLGGCVDLHDFEGGWRGTVIAEPEIRTGFEQDVGVALRVDEVTRQTVRARLSSTDERFSNTQLIHVSKSAADALASLTFDTGPLQTFLLFAPLAGDRAGETALLVLSFFGDDHLELRVVRVNDLFGVFYLERE